MNMAKRLSFMHGQGSQRYLPQMQKDVDRIRKEYKKFNAEPLFDHHVLPVLDFALSENIVTASEVENPKEKGNRRLMLLILCHHLKEVPWHVAKQISQDLSDDLKLDALDKDPKRQWSEYARILRRPDGTLTPHPLLKRLAEKALYEESNAPEFYGVGADNPGIRAPQNWGADKVVMVEPDLIVYRKFANILGYRKTYNMIGQRALESITDPELKELLKEVRIERAKLEDALQNTRRAMNELLMKVCKRLNDEGIPFRLDVRDEKGEASMVFKLKKYRSNQSTDPRNKSLAELNDNAASSIVVLKNKFDQTENIRGVRKAEEILYEEAEAMRLAGKLPYLDLNPKYYTFNPKPNFYRADHFDFMLVRHGQKNPKFVNMEIKVLSEEMDQFNNFGGAAHIAYKDGKEYENASGMQMLRKTILENIDTLFEELSVMNGNVNGARFAAFPKRAVAPVSSNVKVGILQKNGVLKYEYVSYQEGDFGLDILARSGLSISDYSVNSGKCFCTLIEPGDTVILVPNSKSMSPIFAKNLYNSKNSFKQFTRQKLAEVFQNGGKSKPITKASKRKSSKK